MRNGSWAAETKRFDSLSEIYLEVITNRSVLMLLLAGFVLFLILQKGGECAHTKLVSEALEHKVDKQMFGTYFQSLFHAVMVSVCSLVVMLKFEHRSEELESISEADEQYILILLYKMSTVLSVAYFVILTYELFGIEQTMHFRVTMFIHHTAGIMCQSIVFVANPIFVVVSGMSSLLLIGREYDGFCPQR